MSEQGHATQPTVGQLFAEVARWTVLTELRRENVAMGESFPDNFPEGHPLLEKGRQKLAEAEANAAAAIRALDAVVGVTASDLHEIGKQLAAVRGGQPTED